MGLTMIGISGGSANGSRKNVCHEMMWPGGFDGRRGCVSVNEEEGDSGNSCVCLRVVGSFSGK